MVVSSHAARGLAADIGIPEAALDRPVVCIQGLGFVGAAMSAVVASARNNQNEPIYTVVGVDLDSQTGRRRAEALSHGRLPFVCLDEKMSQAMATAHQVGNLFATVDARAYALAATTVVDIAVDVDASGPIPSADLAPFRKAIETLGSTMQPGSLILVESTLPPGTCEHVVAPTLADALAARDLAPDAIHLAHSYERVMPGPDYFDSIVNFWRVFAGRDEASAAMCERFLCDIVDTQRYPLTPLHSMTASETAKVLENSYRAATIAFIDEWGRFAELAGVDLFQVIDAIRMRPTHSNMRQPGFGVGGYCLTKDPYFAGIAVRQFFPQAAVRFPISEQAVVINNNMPLANLDRLSALLGGSLEGRRLLILGVAYRSEIDDTRYSASEPFVREAQRRGAEIICHDPYVRSWPETGLEIWRDLPDPTEIDAVILAVAHAPYCQLDYPKWIGQASPLIFDANSVLSDEMRTRLRQRGLVVESTGRGLGQ